MADNTMTIELIQDMVNNYKTKQYVSITSSKENPMDFDAQSVHFNLEALKDFIKKIEEEVEQHPDHGVRNLGLRFYYAAYPENTSWDGYGGLESVPPAYAKLHTLVVVPTTEVNGVTCDFDPMDVETYNGDKPSGAGLMIMAENHGPLTPPGSSSGLWF